MDIYYVSSHENINVEEVFQNHKLEAFITKMINLNNDTSYKFFIN